MKQPIIFQVSSWHLPKHLLTWLGTWVGLFVLDQAAVLVFTIFFHTSPILAFILGTIFGLIIIAIISNYQKAQEPLNKLKQSHPFKHLLKLEKKSKNSEEKEQASNQQPQLHIFRWVIFNWFVTYLAVFAWALIGRQILGIKLNGQVSSNQANIASFLHHGFWPLAFIIIFSVIFAPAIEEFLFRVMVMTSSNSTTLKIQAILSVLVFALAHMLEQNTTWQQWTFDFIEYVIIGIMLALNYYHFKNFRLNYLLHMTWNSFSMIALLAIAFH